VDQAIPNLINTSTLYNISDKLLQFETTSTQMRRWSKIALKSLIFRSSANLWEISVKYLSKFFKFSEFLQQQIYFCRHRSVISDNEH